MTAWVTKIFQGPDQWMGRSWPVKEKFHEIIDQETTNADRSNLYRPVPIFPDQVKQHDHTKSNR